MPNGQALISFCWSILDDVVVTHYFPQEDILKYLSDGQRILASQLPFDSVGGLTCITKIALTVAPAGESFGQTALPADFFMFRSARLKVQDTYRTARKVPLEEMFATERTESTMRASRDNPVVSIYGTTICAAPTSTSSVSDGIQLMYQITLTELAASTSTTQAPQISEVHHYQLCQWALGQAFQKIDVNRSGFHRDNFLAYIQACGGRWTNSSMAMPKPRRADGDIPGSV